MANTKVPIELSSTPGIVDNSTATAITIDGTGAATFSGSVTADGLNVAGGGSLTFSELTSKIIGPLNQDFIIQQRGNADTEALRIQNLDNNNLAKFDKNGDISFYEDTGTIAKFFWDASAESLGIGTSTPQKLLDITDSSSGESIPVVISNKDVTAGTGQKVTLGFGLSRNSGAFKPEAGTIEVGRDSDWTASDANIDSYMAFSTYLNNAATEKMRIDSAGKVGIGTTTPEARLHASGGENSVHAVFGTRATRGLEIGTMIGGDGATDNTAFYNMKFSSNGSHVWQAGGVERMRIDSAGNVGIGTTTPAYQLTLSSNPSFWEAGLQTEVVGGNQVLKVVSDAFGGGGRTGNIEFHVNSVSASPAVKINASGDLLVGTTSADAKMVVKGSGTGTAYTFRTSDSSGNFSFAVRDDGLFNTGVKAASPYNLTTASAANVHVLSNGTIYRSTSSQRYKNTIQDATHGLTELLTLRPVTYKGNDDGDLVFGGLIAEEVHDAGLTEFVQYNDEGQPDALAYSNMVSLCIKSVQEQQAIIEALTARLEALEGA